MKSAKSLSTHLGIAAERGELRTMARLLESGAKIDGFDARKLEAAEYRRIMASDDKEVARSCRGGMTALMRASDAGQLRAVEALLKRGATPDIRDDTKIYPVGRTALMYAALRGHAS